MMSKILVPVDFSDSSAAGLRYAQALAREVGASHLKVVHVFTPQTATAGALTVPPMEELMEQRDANLTEFLNGIPRPAGISRKSELMLGFAADKIVRESSNHHLIVMGSSGDADLLEEVFGSISSEVAEKAHCPVLLVPRKATFTDYHHILYASNDLSLSRASFVKFRDFSRLFEARVHFVHVNDATEPPQPGEREALFAPLFSNPNPEFAFELHEVQADSVQEGLVEYLHENPIELAVMVTRQRGFWERLFHHSETRRMVLHPETALLILHEES